MPSPEFPQTEEAVRVRLSAYCLAAGTGEAAVRHRAVTFLREYDAAVMVERRSAVDAFARAWRATYGKGVAA